MPAGQFPTSVVSVWLPQAAGCMWGCASGSLAAARDGSLAPKHHMALFAFAAHSASRLGRGGDQDAGSHSPVGLGPGRLVALPEGKRSRGPQ